jgi:hypothetical protein
MRNLSALSPLSGFLSEIPTRLQTVCERKSDRALIEAVAMLDANDSLDKRKGSD